MIFALEKRNNIKTIKFLLSAGADINTDLICAVQNNNIGIIADLIILGADINTKDKNGKTALSYAKDRKKTAIIKILKNAGAK